MARIRTLSVGGVKNVPYNGSEISTGIYKYPVEGPVSVVGVNLIGDDQADRTVHGGPDKAVYAFPSEHYPSWRESFPEVEFNDGAFGENLTTIGLIESDMIIGSIYQCGSAKLRITQPRMPCHKLALRLGHKAVLKHMLTAGQTGFYFAIEQEGELQAGDEIEMLMKGKTGLSVSVLTSIYASKSPSQKDLLRMRDAEGLSKDWRDWAAEKISKR